MACENLTKQFCDNLVNAKFEDLSEQNITCFKDRLLDIIGCTYGGMLVRDNDVLDAMMMRFGGAEEASAFLTGKKLPIINAAALNAIRSRSNDYGCMFTKVKNDRIASHYSESTIPTALTLGDYFGCSGKEVMINEIAGQDLAARILYTFSVRWPVDMLLVSSVTTAVASRFYKLNSEETLSALSYAVTGATDPGNAYYDYSQEFKLHNGEGARCAVMSCELAKGGWRGLADPYYGHWGLVEKYTGKPPINIEDCVSDIGKVFYTEGSFKVFPGGIPNTPASLAGIEIRKQMEGRYKISDIEKVEILRSDNALVNYYSNPFVLNDQINALFSFQFQTCCALQKGDILVQDVQTDAIRNNPELLELIGKSSVGVYEREDKTQEIASMRIIVTMKDGTTFTVTNSNSKMHDYPTREFVTGKFLKQFDAYGKQDRKVAEKIMELVYKVDELEDIRELIDLIR